MVTWTPLLSGFARARRVGEAEVLFRRMPKRMPSHSSSPPRDAVAPLVPRILAAVLRRVRDQE
ncbi:hypothetical protein ACP70R_011832 [Stipagrostis hirtigluma subsp. patula]